MTPLIGVFTSAESLILYLITTFNWLFMAFVGDKRFEEIISIVILLPSSGSVEGDTICIGDNSCCDFCWANTLLPYTFNISALSKRNIKLMIIIHAVINIGLYFYFVGISTFIYN